MGVMGDGLATVACRVFVPAATPLVHVLITSAHGAGLEGVQRTLHRLRRDFQIPGDKSLV